MPNKLHLEGQRFGKWVVLSYLGQSRWDCICDCGTANSLKTSDLRSGKTNSCGCVHAGTARSFKPLHGAHRTPEYRIWKHMRERCRSPNDSHYQNYGARGISVCARWDDFANFISDMGLRPADDYSIERNDVNGNYEPSNCIWLPMSKQARNMTKTSFVEYKGERHKLLDLADDLKISADTLHKRALRGSLGFKYA